MRILDYFQPVTVEEAIEYMCKSPHTTKILAGGTDLIIQLRERKLTPEYIVDLGCITELRGITEKGGNLVIGSMTTYTVIENDPLVRKYMPLLAQAASSVGSPQIRNTGTIGGNLANAATAADSIPALLALDARAVLRSGRGEREVAVGELLIGSNKTNLTSDEILTYIVIPLPPSSTYGTFVKLGRRKALAIARLNLGLTVNVKDNGEIGKVTLAVGAVGASAYRVVQVEKFLEDKKVAPELFAAAGELLAQVVAAMLGSRPTATYKKTISKAAFRRALANIGTECGRW